MMFTRFYSSRHRSGQTVMQAAAKPFNGGDGLLKIRQTIFVGIGVVGFVLLFMGK
jgi:hypothetical protein